MLENAENAENIKGAQMRDGAVGDGAVAGGADQGGEPELTFDGWLAQQPEPVKALLDRHTKGLKNALESERAQSKDLQKQLRDVAKQLEAGSATREQVEGISRRLAEASQQAMFYDAAHSAGVTNLKLAYMAARDAGLINDGRCDFGELRKMYPELFAAKKVLPPATAGNGTEVLTRSAGMNDFIRAAAGRK